MSDKKTCLIPRNLNRPDSINIVSGLKLKVLDLPLILSGGMFGLTLTQNMANPITKSIVLGISIGAGYLSTLIKAEGQDLKQLIPNSTIYVSRKILYAKKKKIEEVKLNEENNKGISDQYSIQVQ